MYITIFATVVTQYYEADVNKEHVIRGNSAILKCLIPSFVADFVEVVSWHTDQDETYYPDNKYGLSLTQSEINYFLSIFLFIILVIHKMQRLSSTMTLISQKNLLSEAMPQL